MTGFSSPNYTQVPNDLFDIMLPQMGEVELKVVLHAIRQTLGFRRGSDAISLSQFMKATGLSRQGVIKGIAAAVERGVMKEGKPGKRGVKTYELVYEIDQSTNVTSTSQQNRPVDAATSQQNRHTKESIKKKGKESPTQTQAQELPIAEQASVSDAPEHLTPAQLRGVGMGALLEPSHSAAIAKIKADAYWQAYVRGWDGIEPEPSHWLATKILETAATLERRGVLLEDVEELTRQKLKEPKRKGEYRFTYLIQDLPSFLNQKRNAQKQKARDAKIIDLAKTQAEIDAMSPAPDEYVRTRRDDTA